MRYYIGTNGFMRIGSQICAPNGAALRTFNNGEVVQFVNVDFTRSISDPIMVISLEKEDDSNYTDLDEILTEVGRFFL